MTIADSNNNTESTLGIAFRIFRARLNSLLSLSMVMLHDRAKKDVRIFLYVFTSVAVFFLIMYSRPANGC